MSSKLKKLNQVVAIRKGVSSRVDKDLTTIYQTLKNPSLFNGHSKKYYRKDDASETFPDDNQKVQFNAAEQLARMGELEIELFDIELTADAANCSAKADIIVDGKVIQTGVPAVTLLFLEKRLGKVRDSIISAPELATDENWVEDANSKLFRSDARMTSRTKKDQRALVLHPPTKEHPAQTAQITVDVVVGEFETVKLSGALPHDLKQRYLKRVDKLIDAVRTAREQANLQEAPDMKLGEAMFSYLLA